MSSGYYLSSPFLYFNLGCHMMYILKNRLDAQNIKRQKSIKIIGDIVTAVFQQNYILGILVPQEPVTISKLKQIFYKLAHSSIMKLDQSSMQKLLFLMIMTLKREVFMTSSPLQLYTLTLSHLLNLAKQFAQVKALQNLEQAIQAFQRQCSRYSFIQYLEIKQHILSQLQPFQTKIVNFIEKQQQTEKGKLIFTLRNIHNQKSLGSATNQSDLQFTKINNSTSLLFYQNWLTWKTTLVINFVKDYTQASMKRKERQIATSKVTNKQKSLGDILNLKIQDLNDFQVKFQEFQGVKPQGQGLFEKQQTGNSKIIKSIQKKQKNSIKQKINAEFGQLNINQKEGDDELDLLQMMDS